MHYKYLLLYLGDPNLYRYLLLYLDDLKSVAKELKIYWIFIFISLSIIIHTFQTSFISLFVDIVHYFYLFLYLVGLNINICSILDNMNYKYYISMFRGQYLLLYLDHLNISTCYYI